MKVKLLQDWSGHSAGDVIEMQDAKAERLIGTKLVEKVVVNKAIKKAKRKQSEPQL